MGNIGAEQMRSSTAIGDPMNLAARLQNLAEPGQVVVGPSTSAALDTSARVSRHGWVKVKGKRDPVRLLCAARISFIATVFHVVAVQLAQWTKWHRRHETHWQAG
ncbi:adenylate/guanylate cyclase domain-containing protein [Mycobacterium sp. 050128]|uniref:adenylate/guanylate cyclase domain-containing protein n=1 Tax=Mycobacterium sp. 050128 TaxID=3096112 RepID=UPI002ED85AD9